METNENMVTEVVETVVETTNHNGWVTAGMIGGLGIGAVCLWEFAIKPVGRWGKKKWDNRKKKPETVVVPEKDVTVKDSKK